MGAETVAAIAIPAAMGALTGGAGAGMGSLFGTGAGAGAPAAGGLFGNVIGGSSSTAATPSALSLFGKGLFGGAAQGGLQGGMNVFRDSLLSGQSPLNLPDITMPGLNIPSFVENSAAGDALGANPLFSQVLPQSPLGKLWGLENLMKGGKIKPLGTAEKPDENEDTSMSPMMAPRRIDYYSRLY